MDFFSELNPYLVRQDSATGGEQPQQDNQNNQNNQNQGLQSPLLTPTQPVINQTYVENILRVNIGKSGSFYFTYTDSEKWRDECYKGVIEQAGRDHFILRDPKTNKRYLLQLVYFDYAEFDEEVNYQFG